MRSNYKKLGDYIRQVNVRNVDGKIDLLVGVNLDKKFMPSVANIIGADLTKYKVVKKGQFGCKFMSVGRDGRLPISLMQEHDEAIISSAYYVFEVKDENELLSEYLMMWLSRSENDRYLWFMSGADVRGSISWEDFCSIDINVPSIDKQIEIVKEYHTITDRIKLNEQLNQKLEDTAQSIYKEWFMNFEFPNENRKPYKSNGGKMKYSEELDMEIPNEWSSVPYTNMIDLKGGGTPSTEIIEYWDGKIPFFTPKDVSESIYSISTEKNITQLGFDNSSTKIYPINTVFITARGTVGAIAMASTDMAMNQSCYAAIGKDINQFFVYQHTLRTLDVLKNHANGGVFGALVTRDFEQISVLYPDSKTIYKFGEKSEKLFEHILIKQNENHKLHELKDVLLSKMAIIEG
ncbi:restriction endonuclease subunit S [Sulfurimonas lithotrophica]|uniref:Restriction endonuclease subunit S n=1 Tax=Sulfurimonas lithotrophica TaxID=2590022 RepID=A0A5P8P188_9BACT|nr:restriction endonuclease subunit S [Sulfurimonas lithotrophica]QFR49381.1 restriction endonuclease subunit S [Sulfurimonas lithotrophica]